MGLSVYARVWRAGIVAFGLALFGPAGLRAEPSAPVALVEPSAEPFGLVASSLTSGGLYEKWLGVQRRFDDDMVQLALCEGDRDGCVSPAALKFLDIVDAANSSARISAPQVPARQTLGLTPILSRGSCPCRHRH